MKRDPRIRQIRTLLRSASSLLAQLEEEIARLNCAPRVTLSNNVPYRLYSNVARECECSPQHVRRVALGLSKSARVMEVIKRHGGAQ
jgi:hypothetical protein